MNTNSQMRIQPVILSGGAGRRLWPVSRAMYPKQFQRFNAPLSLFQATAERVGGECMAAPLVVCNEEHRFIAAEQLAQIGVSPADIVLEPTSRNTAPAILAAALWAQAHDSDGPLLILPSDHIVENDAGFPALAAEVADHLESGGIALFGVRAEWPEPDFGYIRPAEDVPETAALRGVAEFREKPEEDALESMLKDQNWLWNTGMVLATPATLIERAEAAAPDMLGHLKAAFETAVRDLDFFRLGTEDFDRIEAQSFDRLILERAPDISVATADMTWTDASNWQAIWQSGRHDKNGNLTHGDTILEDTSNCLVVSEDTLTTTLGIDNLAVIVTDDSVLVADLDNAKDLSRVVDRVATSDGEKDLFHSTVYRPWGSYKGLALGDRFQVKEIVVKPGASLSLQKHFHRAEHWIVVEGTAKVRCGDDEFLLNENQSTYIPLGEVHRLENPGKIPIRLIEVQSGSYLGEDDIVRFEDTYGRN